jgi:hypothetical protein
MPCNPVKASQHFAGTYCLHLLAWRLCEARNQHEVLLLPASCWFLRCSSQTLTVFPWTTQCHIAEDRTLYTHCCVILSSYISWNINN